MSKQKFGDWLIERLAERDMTQADLSRASGLDTGVISNIINNKRQQPAVDSCKAISRALDLPLEEVYRAADILPEKPDTDKFIEAVLDLMSGMDISDKEDIVEYVRLRRRLREDKASNDPRVAKRASRRPVPT
jgi:transcriptional regulator with XRE-family HTH domain